MLEAVNTGVYLEKAGAGKHQKTRVTWYKFTRRDVHVFCALVHSPVCTDCVILSLSHHCLSLQIRDLWWPMCP